MHFNSLTDITASDIILDISLHIMPVVLLMDSIYGSSHALVASCGVIMINFYDLALDCFNLGNIDSVFKTDQLLGVYFLF